MSRRGYRRTAAGVIVFLLVGTAMLRWPVAAQQAPVLYDDFNAKFIDPDRWLGLDQDSTSEQAREIKGNALRLANRVYSRPESLAGRAAASYIRFSNPAAVTEMEAELRVMETEASSCSATPATASANISGSFFNGGGGTTPNDRTNDVRAGVTIRRTSDSADPPGVLRGTAFLTKCGDAQCTVNPTFAFAALGNVSLKERVRVGVEWDEANNRFVFQFSDNPPESLSYADDVSLPVFPAGVNEKAIQARNSVSGCGGGLRSVAFMDLHVDDVRVNVP